MRPAAPQGEGHGLRRRVLARVPQRLVRGVAALSAFMLLVSGLSLSALTAGIEIAEDQRPAIGPPAHRFADDGQDLPAGAQARRDGIPRAAFERFTPIPARGPAVFGGDRIYDIDVDGTSYRVHEFTTVGTATLTVTRPTTVEYLVLGGGGGGGNGYDNAGGGGGGAGGLLAAEMTISGSLEVVVGGGGVGGEATRAIDRGSNGGDSRLGDVVALGGGGGSGTRTAGFDGGSGGGGGGRFNDGETRPGGASTPGQGHPGGKNVGQSGNQGAGGGGAGGAGADGQPSGAPGGPGRSLSITGSPITYARGGDGGSNLAASSGASGADGRGDGGGAGSANGSFGSAGGAGGSGIVIVRYEIPRSVWGPVATGGDVTHFVGDGTDGTVAGVRYRVHTFTANSTFLVPEGSTIPEVDVLLVGGGGGGGTRHGGGGGGGGVVEVLGHQLGGTGSFPVQVGTGGAGMTTSSNGANGGDSTALGLTAVGGGRGAGTRHGAGSGGSGGGSNVTAAGAAASPGATGQGNAGGAGRTGPNEGDFGGGGGGGAGQPGSPATAGGAAQSASGGQGGDGRVSTMTGAPVVYGGGGGGSISHLSTGVVGLGGLGGGGNGGALGWELYDASSVGRRLSWRVWQHGLAHPSNATGFEAFFSGTPHSTGSAPMIAADQSATGNTLGTVNVVNWLSAANLTSLDGVSLPRTDNFAFEVTGWFVPRETGTYHFTLESDDAADLRIGATTVAAFYGGRGTPNLGTTVGSVVLTAGQAYAFRARMEEGTGGEGLRVFWQTPSQRATSTTTWWQNADELVGNRPSGSPLNAAELGRFVTLSARFATQRGVATVVTQTHGATTTPNTLNWSHPSSGASTELPLPSVIGVGGLADDFMVTVAGTFVPKESGTYTFALSGDDAVDLAVGGTMVVSHYGQKAAPAVGSRTGTVNLQAGVPVRIVVRHHQRDGGAELRLYWRRPSQTSGWYQDAEELRSTGRDGVDGLGGGGGAGGFSGGANAPGGRGGDGTVVIRYPLAREVGAIPSGVRDAVAGEAKDSAVLRWQVPAISPPAVSLAGYRIERAPVGSSTWTEVTSGVAFTTTGSGAQTFVRADVDGIPSGPRHRFRITPLGEVDGPTTVVTPVAKGGDTVTFVGSDVVHQYTTVGSGDLELGESRSVRYLVVGGGGGGGRGHASNHGGGGGGGGQVVEGTEVLQGTIGITVGGGGARRSGAGDGDGIGSASALGGVATAAGGGGGAFWDGLATVGASGGGGAAVFGTSGVSGRASGADGTAGKGFRGGDGQASSGNDGGGGGGAGGAGRDWNASGAEARGGDGVSSSITGTSRVYGAGGGGGRGILSGEGGTFDGPGDGGSVANRGPGTPGEKGSGGGGGGGSGGSGSARDDGGDGGSGTVVLRYPFLDSGVEGGVFASTATSAVLRWEDPASGSDTITGYRIERQGPPSSEWGGAVVVTPTPNATVHTFEVSGLSSNPQRRFRVTALHGELTGSVTELSAVARGGDSVTLVGTDVVHQFTTVGSAAFELREHRTVRYLIAGGGASGTRGWCNVYFGHGGGGGGVSAGSLSLQTETFTAVVGAGGAGRSQDCNSAHTGVAGSNSSLSSSLGLLASGTGGRAADARQKPGGDSGDGVFEGTPAVRRAGGDGGAGTYGAGGGGGAGGPGVGKDGGPGAQSDITGEMVEYGRGGAGRDTGGFGSPGEAGPAQGPGAGGSDGSGGGVFRGGNAGTVILRYPLVP